MLITITMPSPLTPPSPPLAGMRGAVDSGMNDGSDVFSRSTSERYVHDVARTMASLYTALGTRPLAI